MITDQSYVFILGAGASKPLGFPSSSELYAAIEQNFTSEIEQLDPRTRNYENMLLNSRSFVNAIGCTPVYSIDKYLNINKSLKSIGAAAIATAIYRAEIASKRPDRREYGDWYTYLFDRMIEGLDSSDALMRLHDNQVAFITFNYDRSLEHFLFKSLYGLVKNDNRSMKEAAITMNKIQILHVFGQIGYLPWQVGDYDGGDGICDAPLHEVSFGSESIVPANVGALLGADIQLMYEERQESENLRKIRGLIDTADRVLFLGFGYAPENLRLLEIPDRLKGKQVFGTALGMVANEVSNVKSRLRVPQSIHRPVIYDCDCLHLLRDTLT